MTITEKSFILVEEPCSQFIVGSDLEQLLREEMRPILWFRKGLSCVVPVEVLKNVLETFDFNKKRNFGRDTIQINWKQCWPLTDSRAVAVLSGLEY